MPELPEVETVRRTLEPIVGRRVVGTTLHRRDVLVVPGDPEGGFARSGHRARPRAARGVHLLRGDTIAAVRRHGKQLALVADSGRCVCVHLGMTGQMLRNPGRGPLGHVHATWRFDDTTRVVFRDPRRFGGLWALDGLDDLQDRWSRLGPDGLVVTPGDLTDACDASTRAIKAALLDQHVVAGIGNIYADEALHRAGIRPDRAARTLKPAELHRLVDAARKILCEAIAARGSTIRDYADSNGASGSAQLRHLVYGRAGAPCTSCGTPLQSGLIAQRTSVWCMSCQR